MTQEERIIIMNIFERLGAEISCGDCIFYDACVSKAECIYDKAHDVIENDAVPDVHGHWNYKKPLDNGAPVVECSECGVCFCDLINNHMFMYHYCPNCGAKMDERSEFGEPD